MSGAWLVSQCVMVETTTTTTTTTTIIIMMMIIETPFRMSH
jgi:hypothetical protein